MLRIFRLLMVGVVIACTGFAPARAQTEVEIGYMPILPVSQLFVELGDGWMDEAGIKPKLVEFQNGPAMVQALLAGQLDVAHFGIGPAMVARAKGADIKVVASSIVEQISFVALGDLADYFETGDAKTAFSRFLKDKGRKAIVTTFPVGSVPETVLQYWLRKQLGANVDDIEIIYQGAAQVQQALLTGAVDAAAILEPVVAIVKERVDNAKVVAKGSQMFPGQPGAVLAVREGLIRDHPEIVENLVAFQKRATDMLNDDTGKVSGYVQAYVGGGRLPIATVEAALKNSRGTFVADPNVIVKGTQEMHDFQTELGTLKEEVDIGTLFDATFYDRIGGP